MAQVTGLSGNEIFCLAKKHLAAGEIVVGNSVNSMGFLGGIGAGLKNIVGGEIAQVTAAIHEGRAMAFQRMAQEAKAYGAAGVAGVTSELRAFSGSTEFLFVGSCVHTRSTPGADTPLPAKFFTSAGDAQELFCHMDAGYVPIQHAFGNIAYSMGVGRGIVGSLKTLVRGEIAEYSDIFNATRHHALERLVAQARDAGANAVVGVRTTILPWMGTHEMLMTGTAARHPALPAGADRDPVTSDMTGEELWAMTSLGYAPVKLLMSTSIYSLGVVGGFLAAFKSFTKGEVSDLTTLIHDAREHCIGRLKGEADALGCEEVVGVKTYIAEIGNGLVEFMAIGTAVKPMPGFACASPALPVQAIVRDRDTWVDGDFGFSLDRSES
ncbi:MAG: heavy metal-binding domain-containing protein [Pseudomonadota bacterium]